jgi:phosphoribosylformimino-5-aminoimidazole carboxamide ribotide isomerase
MRAIPAIDLREGACVQLVGGEYAAERVRIEDVTGVCRKWKDAGLTWQHIVDLDAATGRGNNRKIIELLAKEPGVTLQVGGGVRDDEAVDALIGLGVSRVVVGTRAVEDAAWLERVSMRYPGRLVVAADVRQDTVVTRGWAEATTLKLDAFLAGLEGFPLAGVLVTAVHVEGQLQGVDRELMKRAVSFTHWPLIASGGVTTMEDLRALSQAGAAAAVIGMALYTGRLDPQALAAEFGE